MTRTFITATGTAIGKTLVTSLLARQLRAQGRTVRALKPVISGFSDATLDQSDTAELLRAMDLPVTPQTIQEISPWRFEAPLSPDMAALREGRTIDFRQLIDFCEGPADAEHTLIEGVGGAFVPLDDDHTVADWIAALRAPALLVCGSYLGTLSHTIATLEALAQRRVRVTGIILSESPESPVPLAETQATLERFVGPIPVLGLPRLTPRTDTPDFTALVS
ncbi:dethiobiotin synthase [Emcibacter sp. SYSU 3D8]|uniref:dethiobiotin synthase n=1 Tax=Emcibacter sp. SYSU 3D8 TaxID=3133969 RepID=UPI0031FE87D5